MEEKPTRATRDVPEPASIRLRHRRRSLVARRRSGDGSFGFGARLFVTVLLSFALIGVVGYVLLDRSLTHNQILAYAATQRADAKGFEALGARAANPAQAIRRVDPFLDFVKQRPGAVDVTLIDPHHVVRTSSNDSLIGTKDLDRHMAAAVEHGAAYAGHQVERTEDRRDFEFIVPVNLPGGRYAYEVVYDHRAFDAQLHDVRTVIGLIALLALFGGGGVFYLVGGRRLMRDHRMSLRRATRDGLTDLPNHRAFQEELPQTVASAERYQEPLALALVDVDDFKLINDREGHPHGDAILKRVSAVLHDVRPGDRPYRIGGDEFALLFAHADAEGAKILARRLCRNLADVGIKVSVGLSALRAGEQGETLRAEADAALYETKRHGGNGSAHFDDMGEQLAVGTSEKKEAVRRLIEEGRLTTDFQPIWDIGTETLLGVEALARPDPSYGLSGPAEAFDIAEQIGRVHLLDVLCAVSALRVAPELEPNTLIFINLSPSTLDLDADGDDWLQMAVEQAGLPPKRVVVEVTERFGGRTASVVRCLQRLRQQGFKIAVDDVGTGNSGLEMLRKIEAEFVKIDRSIVSAAATEPGARAVLMAMATFARQTGAFVIAEGIEDEETLQFLRAIDDHRLDSDPIIQGGQGYGLGRPSPHLTSHLPDILRTGHLVA
jgi:diguanylate cyclase (GGDEF)-like protein